ncbi:MAG: hypothetical protein ACPG5P_03745 [Saprospiraceae bacterium]
MFNVELPMSDSMDEYLDFILKHVRPMSEDLREVDFWWGKRWMEVRDDMNFHEAVIHMFSEGGGYMVSVDGNVSTGAWEDIEHPNAIILAYGGRHEMYDLAFLNDDFFILKKHGDQRRKGQRKYFVMGHERAVSGLEWRDCMEYMFNIYRNNSRWTGTLAVVVAVIIVILALSVFR